MPDNETGLHAAAKKLAEKTLVAARGAANEAEFRIPISGRDHRGRTSYRRSHPAARRGQPDRRPR